MTRKQALTRICEIIDTYGKTEEVQEIQDKIREIISEMPFTQWSEDTISDTIDQWIIDNGRIPNTKDLTRKGLPPVPVIKNRFKMPAKDFLDKYYPDPKRLCNSKKYCFKLKEEWISDFIKQFESIKPKSASDYNRRRAQGSPAWFTVASICGLTKWSELLDYCELKKPENKVHSGRKSYKAKYLVDREVDVDKVLSRL